MSLNKCKKQEKYFDLINLTMTVLFVYLCWILSWFHFILLCLECMMHEHVCWFLYSTKTRNFISDIYIIAICKIFINIRDIFLCIMRHVSCNMCLRISSVFLFIFLYCLLVLVVFYIDSLLFLLLLLSLVLIFIT